MASDRLEYLEELVAALRPLVLAEHTEHGFQGLSGLVGQYRAALKEIEDLKAAQPEAKGTVLDELNQRRALKGEAARPSVPAKRQQRR